MEVLGEEPTSGWFSGFDIEHLKVIDSVTIIIIIISYLV
jgi:hypothetical protein